MALSWVSICNMALRRIGKGSLITSLAGTDKESVACNDAYEAARDAVLEDFDWKCASYRKALTQDSSTPAFGWDYQYSLPTTPWCLVVREIYPEEADYVVEGRKLLTDQDNDDEDLCIRYTKRVTDPTELSNLCAKAIAWRIAAEISYHITQSNSMVDQIMKEYYLILDEAKRSNQEYDKNHDEDAPSSDRGNVDWINAGR